MTDIEYSDWLASQSAMRVILVEAKVNIAGTEVTKYISNKAYMTADATRVYLPYVLGGITAEEALTISGNNQPSYGDLELINTDGELDDWLTYAWTNREIKILLGDVRWPLEDFRPIFSGIIADVVARNTDSLNIRFRNKLERLNTPLHENLLGNYWHGSIVSELIFDNPNKDLLKPLLFGEVHNLSPLLIDSTELEYMISDSPIESIIEVRDNGVPITSFVPELAAGKFKLTKTPAGTITVSAQGVKAHFDFDTETIVNTYSNNIAELVGLIVVNYGKSYTKLIAADLDIENLIEFAENHEQSVGIYLSDRTNVLNVCQDLVGSVGAQISMSSEGKLQLLKVAAPIAGGTQIKQDQMYLNSFQPTGTFDIIASYKLGYAKNWTVQPDLITGIPPEHKDLFKKEWLTVTGTDNTVKALHKLEAEPVQVDSMLLVTSEAQTESDRRLDLTKVRRATYSFTAPISLFTLKLGEFVEVFHHRHGMSAGVPAQIVRRRPNWLDGRIDIEVFV